MVINSMTLESLFLFGLGLFCCCCYFFSQKKLVSGKKSDLTLGTFVVLNICMDIYLYKSVKLRAKTGFSHLIKNHSINQSINFNGIL